MINNFLYIKELRAKKSFCEEEATPRSEGFCVLHAFEDIIKIYMYIYICPKTHTPDNFNLASFCPFFKDTRYVLIGTRLNVCVGH